MEIKPRLLIGLFFYVAQYMTSRAGDFLALSLVDGGHVELRYNLGADTAVIRSPEKVKKGKNLIFSNLKYRV